MIDKRWRIDIVQAKSNWKGDRIYDAVIAALSKLESEGWTIFSVTSEPNSVAVMIVSWKQGK